MELISEYNKLPQALQEQLTILQDKYYSTDAVLRTYWNMLKYFKEKMVSDSTFSSTSPTEKEVYGNSLFRLALYKTLDVMDIVDPSNIGKIFCYSTKGKPHILLTKIIKPKSDKRGKNKDKQVIVAEGKVNDMRVIIKWLPETANHVKRTIHYEISIYQQLKRVGCPLAKFDKSYKLWGQQVLVMEYLNPISKDDDEYQMGIEVIKQLRKIHHFGCHSDLKLGNVACRRKGDSSSYILIDYGGMTTEPHDSGTGWHRWTWTKNISRVDPEEKNKVITEAIELMELGYTMKALQNIKRGEKDSDPRKGFSGRLGKYIRRCQRIDPKKITEKDYDDLIEILSKD